MIEYFDQSLFDAIIHCIGFGISEETLDKCTVGSFADTYRAVKRSEAHQMVKMVSSMRVAPNADKKDFVEFLESETRWLHVIDRRTILAGNNPKTKGISDLLRDFNKNVSETKG